MLCDVICPKGCDVTYLMYEIDHVLIIGFMTCMSMSMTTGRSHRNCLNLLYEMQRHVFITSTSLLTVSCSSSSSSLSDNFMETQ